MEQIDNLSDDARPNLPDDLPSPEQQLSDLASQIIANIKEHYALDREMAVKINESHDAIHTNYNETHFVPLRIARGRMLLEAQKLVPKGQWQKWCAKQFPTDKSWVAAYEAPRVDGRRAQYITMTSQRDLRACMELARAADPIAAHEAEKANTRERVAKHRQAKKSGVTRADVTPPASVLPVPSLAPAAPSAEIVKDAPLQVEPITVAAPTPSQATNENSEPTPSPVDELVKTTFVAFNTFTEKQRREYAQRIGLWTKRAEDGQLVCGVCNELAMIANAGHRCRPPEIDRETMLRVWLRMAQNNVTEWWEKYSDADTRELFCAFVAELRARSEAEAEEQQLLSQDLDLAAE